MPFPVSRTITVALDASWRRDTVLVDVEHRLFDLGAVNLRRAPDKVVFGVPWLTRYGPLSIVTGGDFAIATDPQLGGADILRVHLSFRRAAIVGAVITYGWVGIGASVLERGHSDASFVGTLIFCTIGYFWLWGMWYLIVPYWLVNRMKLRRFTRPFDAGVA